MGRTESHALADAVHVPARCQLEVRTLLLLLFFYLHLRLLAYKSLRVKSGQTTTALACILEKAITKSTFSPTVFGDFLDLAEPLLAALGGVLHLGNVSAVVEQEVVVHVAQLLQGLDVFQPAGHNTKT